MIFLNIHIAVGIIYLIFLTLSCIDIAYEFKQLYPDKKIPKSNWAKNILSIMKNIIMAFIPALNIVFCWVIIFDYSDLKTKVLDKIYAECVTKEKKNVTHLSETSER